MHRLLHSCMKAPISVPTIRAVFGQMRTCHEECKAFDGIICINLRYPSMGSRTIGEEYRVVHSLLSPLRASTSAYGFLFLFFPCVVSRRSTITMVGVIAKRLKRYRGTKVCRVGASIAEAEIYLVSRVDDYFEKPSSMLARMISLGSTVGNHARK